ncbi:hypothetical protein [Sporanaerobacter sp. PP17-6a]|uniref:hypothetical protein n=1 Tax=Sporanaerobacter sp. PP17-6a TaxID=1891289 RepID=UPI0008A03E01|nr:hypothetical protein [Sporanaerobacter sp. PP17-6a]SCL96982.1 hypothetical protein PP176A_3139 [Sporanaerobacter sp. PP17-6a]
MDQDKYDREVDIRESQIAEQFSIPGAGGIIVKRIGDVEYILLQERCKIILSHAYRYIKKICF